MFKTTKNYVEKFLPDIKKEENHSPSLTEKSGYVPMHVRVQDMLMAGERLEEHRKSLKYDFESGKMVSIAELDKARIIPQRHPSYNLEDAGVSMAKTQLREEEIRENRAKQAEEAKSKEDAEKASQTGQIEPDKALNDKGMEVPEKTE